MNVGLTISMIAAASMSREQILDDLQAALLAYQLDPSEENFRLILMRCTLALSKATLESAGSLDVVLDKLRKKESFESAFRHTENKN